MRVLLVEPPISRHDIGTGILALPEPLALECIAAPLEGHEVRILDMRVEQRLERELRTFRPQIVACGGCTATVGPVKRVLQQVRAHDPAIVTVTGGHHGTLLPHELYEPFIDAVVVGEGEAAFKELVDAVEAGQPLGGVAGLAVRTNGSMELTPERPLLDLDTLPLPARHLVARYRRRYFRGKWTPLASTYTSRGCPHRCSFCAMWKVNRGTCRRRSPERVVEELAQLPEKYVDFIDDNTFAHVDWAMRLCELIKERGLRKTYKVYARSDTVARHPELIRAWRAIGLEIALVGFESFREADLGEYNKRSSVATNEWAIRVLKEHDVEIAAYFVVRPDFTEQDFRELRDYVDRWELLQPVFTLLTPFPGTDFHERVREEVSGVDYELFDFFHAVLPTALPRRQFYTEFVNLYRYAYSLKRRLKYRKKERVFGLSLRQLVRAKRFFGQLAELERHAP